MRKTFFLLPILIVAAILSSGTLDDKISHKKKRRKQSAKIDSQNSSKINHPPKTQKNSIKTTSRVIANEDDYRTLGVTQEDLEFISNDDLIEEVLSEVEQTEFLHENLISEKNQFYEECPIEIKESSCSVTHLEYENSDGSKTKFITVNDSPWVSKVFYPDDSKVVIAHNLEIGGYEDIILRDNENEKVHSISFDSKGRVRSRTDEYKGFFFNMEYNKNEQIKSGSIGKKLDDHTYREVKFPKIY